MFKESYVLPRTETKQMFPLELIYDSPATAEMIEKVNSLHRRPSEHKPSLSEDKGHSKKPSVADEVSQSQDISRSPEVNDMIKNMFGEPEQQQTHEKDTELDEHHKSASIASIPEPQQSRFSKLAVGTSFVARKVQKMAKDSFTTPAVQPQQTISAPPVPVIDILPEIDVTLPLELKYTP